jgi:hypothetical protein
MRISLKQAIAFPRPGTRPAVHNLKVRLTYISLRLMGDAFGFMAWLFHVANGVCVPRGDVPGPRLGRALRIVYRPGRNDGTRLALRLLKPR